MWACKLFLLNESFLEFKIKNTCLILLSHFISHHFTTFLLVHNQFTFMRGLKFSFHEQFTHKLYFDLICFGCAFPYDLQTRLTNFNSLNNL